MITHANYTQDVSGFDKIPNPMMCGEETDVVQGMCVGRQNVLEIGTYFGITTANILATGITVVSIDVTAVPTTLADLQGSAECLPEEQIGSQIPQGLRERLQIRLYDPNDPTALSALLRSINQKFDLIVIDGDHSYQGVSKDYSETLPYLSDSGITLFHDCWWDVDPMPVRGPMKFLDEIGGVILSKTHWGMPVSQLMKLKLVNP